MKATYCQFDSISNANQYFRGMFASQWYTHRSKSSGCYRILASNQEGPVVSEFEFAAYYHQVFDDRNSDILTFVDH